ncbi:DNA cytosine methyltransferase [Sphingomonas cannabina]|uniref:DNA cytosine methyltransferase n=1 Tax=Sphingomonas cannabina TaxID=2899123 RepID=UPI001F1E062F|nr:DNA cytosine methyltransferase [Sphingomonas cannabina]UIJ43708.1 DNA cytosine methyltransferase [Sphingomonas cannabina]
MLASPTVTRVIRHAHVFCGIGGAAKGFNMAKARVGNVVAKFVCTGGIDVDAGAIRNFERLTGTPGTVMDLFSREQYIAFHGKEPPRGWREATPADTRRALCGPDGIRPDVIFLSAPCKGFSGLLSSKQSLTDKYQALNALTLRGVWLICEAFKDGPIPIILFENVPRIQTRGRGFLDQICAILRGYSYNVAETVHDCGKIARKGLAQSRKRFLLIARQFEIIPNFVYEPEQRRLRGVGEVIGKLPLPGDPVAGPMHRVPMLQWKTWMRLALVPAGRDWRALNELAVVDGVLRDYGIVPDQQLRDGVLGVMGWDETAGTIIGNQRSPLHGRHSVADPRGGDWHNEALGVRSWDDTARVVAGASRPHNGAHSVADPRPGYGEATHRHVLGVNSWDDTAPTVSASPKPSTGSFSVADPRIDGHPKSVQLGVRAWDQPAACVKGDVSVGTGPYAVSDPRVTGKPRFNNVFRVVPFDSAAPAVAGPGGPGGGAAVADPRMGDRDYTTTKYKITPWDGQCRTVIGASTTGDGAFAVADPRGGPDASKLHGKHHVEEWAGKPSRAVIGGRENGASAVADPRPVALNGDHRTGYATQGHYGVVGWEEHSGAVPAFAKYDRGNWSVADPREQFAQDANFSIELPQPDDRLVARIIATDGTWHRPFTTMDLAALQSIVDPEEVFYQDDAGAWQARMPFDLDSTSDAEKREWIGNLVPPESAEGVAGVVGEAILLADLGETFTLSPRAVWVSPARIALAVNTDQAAFQWEAARA